MAWTTPGTATAGEVLTAAFWNTNVRDNSLMGSPVYTNEAARDAAITAPSEGMSVYLTAPTVPTATGATTIIPSGIQTIYNGSAWVCVTPVGALSNTQASTATASSWQTTLTGDGTEVSVTLSTGTTARIDLSGILVNSLAGAEVYIGYKVTGATTIAESTLAAAWAYAPTANYRFSVARSYLLTGLTAGSNKFTLSYRNVVGGGNTANFIARDIVVTGIA